MHQLIDNRVIDFIDLVLQPSLSFGQQKPNVNGLSAEGGTQKQEDTPRSGYARNWKNPFMEAE